MHLVVVESPSKAKTIEKYLGRDYKVIASKGHIIDLPKSELGIDVDHNFKPQYVVTNPESVKNIKNHLQDADSLILAVDPDREGEAIGWHIAVNSKLINDKGGIISRKKKLSRIVFTEITKEAVQGALKNPRDIDMNLVNAQQTRRILDRLVGYKLSPLLWKKLVIGLSAGRVQSVAVRLVVDREELRKNFKPEEYWSIVAYVAKNTGKNQGKFTHGKVEMIMKRQEQPHYDDTAEGNLEEELTEKEAEKLAKEKQELEEKLAGLIQFKLIKVADKNPKITNEEACKKIAHEIAKGQWLIASVESKEVKRSPKPPFTTSTLQQTAANLFGMSSNRTMRIAQKLYENGLITYMRTDSMHMSKEAVAAAGKYIATTYGENFAVAGGRFYKSQAKLTQEAHEAIRPSKFNRSPHESGLSGDQLKVYTLIWQRALGSQMADARLLSGSVRVDVAGNQLQANGQSVVFPGYLKVYPDKVSENELPKFVMGEEVFPQTIINEQHYTEPPARFSEATLIKELELNGIGRPSTYAPIISTILARRYVEKINKYFRPTDTGIAVTKLLVDHFPKIVDKDFTALMEEDLDRVADGKINWVQILKDFYGDFSKDLVREEKKIKREDYVFLGKSKEKCPICGKPMIIKLGRYGRFLSCSDFPKCKGMLSLSKDSGKQIDVTKVAKYFLPAPKTDDGRDYVMKSGRFGIFFAHPDYPKVKDAKPAELQPEYFRQVYGNHPKATDGSKMVLRAGRFGEFWAHADYPKVKEVKKINKKEVIEKKKELGLV